ncbi:MAG TPA: EVE domain-containing protein [Rhabdochlamydiaceae bacterium]
MTYWIGVACREHVMRGVKGGFAQVCYGKEGHLKRMKKGDWIIYYSPTINFGEKEPCRSFTAIGQITGDKPYAFRMSDDFIPYRIDVKFSPAKETPIIPLLDELSFIQDKKKWGFPFRRGCFSISEADFVLIANELLVVLNKNS